MIHSLHQQIGSVNVFLWLGSHANGAKTERNSMRLIQSIATAEQQQEQNGPRWHSEESSAAREPGEQRLDGPTLPTNWDEIDASAEREAQSLAFMAEELGIE